MTDNSLLLLQRIAEVGLANPGYPNLNHIHPFEHYMNGEGQIEHEELDRRDGSCTRREILLRYLVLNAVIDQGPDIIGVRQLLIDVTNNLYLKEIRFLHNPLSFFKELGIAIDEILEQHESIRELRSEIWAQRNKTNPSKYNLFMDNSKQALNYAVFRWGVPLALPLLLEKDFECDDMVDRRLQRHLRISNSAEHMSQRLKNDSRYGLGKAIGDKACHLFAKWTVSSFRLLSDDLPNWGPYSFEVPFDSNAGRVLWRCGFFLRYANEDDYIKRDVVQRGKGKQGLNYIRVTNIRGMKASMGLSCELFDNYVALSTTYLKTHTRSPKKVEIQRIPHAVLMATGGRLGVAEFDDGLINIGTNYCFNHNEPDCGNCPVREFCIGHCESKALISDYRT